ncbi:MAG: ABC transporter ATP-binding protein [Candidatus Omnitrophica bacterium]|nr:ABC transporter ATP-binding protein [Candidatus Omnitrophota bacterium]MCM8826423.1 ABC transporter ATP-binding protein [Candidatus Omnitrophota bacterium]
MFVVRAENLYKRFNEHWVVENLNLSIREGEFYCLLGPNGAGKTTTLKLLVGLLKPTKGKIYIGGFSLDTMAEQAKKLVGFIPDTPFLYENLTAIEFLEFIGTIFYIDKDTLKERINFYLDVFGLEEAKNILLRDYSHGMRQRIIYIANLIHKPKVLLVDEPLVGLDPQGINLIKRVLKEKTKEGMAIVMSTHILQIAEQLADRVGIMDRGKLIVEGSLEELKKKIKEGSLEDIFFMLTQR